MMNSKVIIMEKNKSVENGKIEFFNNLTVYGSGQ